MPADAPPEPPSEQQRVEMRRYIEALHAGLDDREAWLFSLSGRDIGELRRLVELDCPVSLRGPVLL